MGRVTEEQLEAMGLEEDLGRSMLDEIKKDKDAQHEWRQLARECYAFESGDQWNTEDKALLEEQNRPPVVFNRMARTINAVTGLEIQNRQEVRYLPRDLADTPAGEVLTGASKWARDLCDAEDEESDAFRDLLICGMGWTETRMDYEADREGMICIDRVDPLEMGWDRTAKKKNIDDARRVWRARDYPKKEAMSRWPGADFQPGDFWQDEHDAEHLADEAWEYKHDQSGDSQSSKDVTVIQVQFYVNTNVHIVLTEMGQMVEFDDERYEKIADYVESRGLRHQRLVVRKWFTMFMSGEEILEITPLECESFTLRPMTGTRDRNKNMWLGIGYLMLDPQRWANKWLSQVMYILNTNSKGGLLAEQSAFANPRQAEDDWASSDSITWLNEGGLGKIQEKSQSQYPAGFDKLMNHALDSITDVTGISMEMLGLAAASNQVGIIEASRKQAGISLLATYFDGLRRYRKEQGRVMAHYVQNYISDGRLVRIMGQGGEQYVPLMKQPDLLKYDIVVDDAPNSPNQKQQALAVLMELIPAVAGMGVQPPPDVLDLLPLPSSFIQKWKQHLASQGQDPMMDQMKQVALADKMQEISESKSKETLNYAKAQAEGANTETDKARTHLQAVKTGADIANPGRGML